MSRGQSYFITLIRNRTRQNNPNYTQIRSLTVESRDSESKVEEQKSTVSYTEMAKTVSTMMRERHKWQQTLLSDFPCFDFSDPLFFRELLKSQNNLLFSMLFFRWLSSNYDHYTHDSVSLNLLFGALLDANAVKAAKSLLETTGFNPEPKLMEQYVKCLCKQGLVGEGIRVYTVLKHKGIVPSLVTCNSVLLGCLKEKKLGPLWKLHQGMLESEVDLERIRCLILALCEGRKVSEGYELLKQVLSKGLDPGHDVYAKLISGFCQIENYACMSEILHTMIARNHLPNIYTYQEIIKGLCNNKKQLEAYRIFNNLKERGYAPDVVVYTIMIHGFCEVGWLGSARKLWFEMINKGMQPNEFTYNVMIHGYFKSRKLGLAREFYSEMLRKGHGETMVSYNMVISGLCSHGKSGEAFKFFRKMSETGVTQDAITYNVLIKGFCKENKVEEGMKLVKELSALGLKPTVATRRLMALMRRKNRAKKVGRL